MAKIKAGWSPLARQVAAQVVRPGPYPVLREEFNPIVALYGEATVQPNSEQEIEAESISNSFGKPIEVREIRFTAAIDDTTNLYRNPAGAIRAMIEVNGKPITAVPTPIWSICRTDRATNQLVEGTERPAASYVLRLSRPMVLPPGAKVRCRFENTGLVNLPVAVGVCFAGKTIDRGPATTFVPYVLFWSSQFRGLSDTGTEVSPEARLTNKLTRALMVDRIIARHATLTSGTPTAPTGTTLYFGDGRGSNTDFASVAPIQPMSTLRLVTSRNQRVIDPAAGLWDVFPTSGALEVGHILLPGDFYKATVTTVANTLFPAAYVSSIKTFQHQIHLSIVGWREEAL